MDRFYFPPWVNKAVPLFVLILLAVPGYAIGMLLTTFDPNTTDVGYAPEQPVPFSHKTHAGVLKMDCLYCHSSVTQSAHSPIPPTATCINCHSPKGADGQTMNTAVRPDSAKLKPVHDSWNTGKPVAWERIHDLPDFVYFNHSAHVNRGVSCVSCHGRIDQMDVVAQAKPLSMAWCLECHRNPEPHLRPPELVTKLDWQPDQPIPFGVTIESVSGALPTTAADLGSKIKQDLKLHPSTDCSTCHR